METQPMFVLTKAIKEGINPEARASRFFEAYVILKNGELYLEYAEDAVTQEEAQAMVDNLNRKTPNKHGVEGILEALDAHIQKVVSELLLAEQIKGKTPIDLSKYIYPDGREVDLNREMKEEGRGRSSEEMKKR